ncbi:MAG: DUF2959 family protein [Planctomycetota bacterium]
MRLRTTDTPWQAGLVAACISCLTACSSAPDPNESLRRVDDFNSHIEKMHVESELAQRRVRSCAESFLALMDDDRKANAARIFTGFQASINSSEEQLESFKTQILIVEESSRPVFEKWRNDLRAIVKTSLRQRSEERLDKARERYLDMIEDAKRAATGFELFNQEIKDIALFLSNDLNEGAIDNLQPELESVATLGEDIDDRLTETMLSAQVYLQNAGEEINVDPEEVPADPESVPAGPIGPVPAGPSSGR